MGKRKRHFDVRSFYVKYLIGNDEVKVMHCPTERMTTDLNEKPLTGRKFKMFRDVV